MLCSLPPDSHLILAIKLLCNSFNMQTRQTSAVMRRSAIFFGMAQGDLSDTFRHWCAAQSTASAAIFQVTVLATQQSSRNRGYGGGWVTLGEILCIQIKIAYIFRYGKGGKSLSGVGRWGLLSQLRALFFAPCSPKSP